MITRVSWMYGNGLTQVSIQLLQIDRKHRREYQMMMMMTKKSSVTCCLIYTLLSKSGVGRGKGVGKEKLYLWSTLAINPHTDRQTDINKTQCTHNSMHRYAQHAQHMQMQNTHTLSYSPAHPPICIQKKSLFSLALQS